MNATLVDLKHQIKEVLIALENRERVTLFYRGKVKGTIIPVDHCKGHKVSDHEFFGMLRSDEQSVAEVMEQLRGGRYNDI